MMHPYLWTSYPPPLDMDGQHGVWSASADARHAAADPEVFVDRTYTPIQILREKSVLVRSGAANRQRGRYRFDFTRFNLLWGDE